MSQLLPFVLFAFVASITPGPTNLLVLSNSARYGLWRALPIVLGACAGAAGIVLLVGLGIGQWLLGHPGLQRAMAWLGVAWLSYLAWQIFRSEAQPIEKDGQAPVRRLGLAGGAGLQLVNPKTWMMAMAVVSLFAGADASAARYALFALVFFLVALPCLGVWALLGIGATRLLRSARALRRFNQLMALLLLGSAWASLLG
ncbi:LysE family translocator [Stutzerimonas nosocomialis]|uniref:LysE family translocator n=1 Tax=Stutzerimonas nosocomialis TaxID=1056496 RepID=UPI0011080323|nr:LysE family translocator [Stutzerimonas nosocomialis]TLX56638.1 LysE family translocator [Stutzerimonas nosocomialis]TLX59660.1 LysE family translocator [Stutzerimonas nosocomialis]